MAISNLNETLLMYTRQKSRLNNQISDIQFNIMSASRKTLQLQSQYNQKLQNYYFMYGCDEDMQEEYDELCAALQQEYEFNLANIDSWEEELELSKENMELRVAEITQNENSFKTLLKSQLKQDFTYGGIQQG